MIEIFNQLKAGLHSLKMVGNQSKMTPAQAVQFWKSKGVTQGKIRSRDQ